MSNGLSAQATARFFFKDNKSCFIRVGNALHILESDAPEVTVVIGNAIADGHDLSGYDQALVEEIKAFLLETFEQPDQRHVDDLLIYDTHGNSLPLSGLPFEVRWVSNLDIFLCHQGPKLIVLNEVSVEELLAVSDQLAGSAFPYVALVVLDHVALLSAPLSDGEPYSVGCLVRRWVETHPSLYRHIEAFHFKVRYLVPPGIWQLAVQKAFNHFVGDALRASSAVDMFDLSTVEFHQHAVVPYRLGSFDGANLELTSSPYLTTQEGNGTRLKAPKDVLQVLEPLVGPFSPIVTVIENGGEDRIGLPVFQSLMASNPLEKSYIVHGGKGTDYYQAKLSAIGEAYERYNARMHGNETLITACYADLSRQVMALDPKTLCLDPSYPFPYSDDKAIEWVEGWSLTQGKKALIPANATFFIYQPSDPALNFIPQDTSGLASGASIEEAVYQGLSEVIERDSYVIHYRQRLVSDTITIPSHHPLSSLVKHLEERGIRLHLKLLRNDTPVYVVHATSEDVNGNFPIYTHGSGASLNPWVAIQRAITETVQLRVTQIILAKGLAPEEIASRTDPYFSWGAGKKEWLSNLLDDGRDDKISLADLPDNSLGDIKRNIEFVVDRLSSNGYHVYAVNLSRADNPITTVRVVIPGMQPLDDTLRRVTPRMFDLPRQLGQPAAITPEDLLPYVLFS